MVYRGAGVDLKLKALKQNSCQNFSIKALNRGCNKVEPISSAKLDYVRRMADRIVSKIGGEENYKFYLKCGWRLKENVIEDVLERSLRKGVREPRRYFLKVCKDEMMKIRS